MKSIYNQIVDGINAGSYAKVAFVIYLMSSALNINAQAVDTWDLSSTTGSSGFFHWGNGVISLTDTVTGSGTCQGAAVTETGSTYNPTSSGAFSRCFSVFFGCPGSDQIGTAGNPYTDLNGDGLAFSFWKTSGSGTYNVNNANTCGGGLGYHNALSGGGDTKMITVEFDTYSSIGVSVDNNYGGGGPGSGVNDEVAIHVDQNSASDIASFNAGQLEDGLVKRVCISYDPATDVMNITIANQTTPATILTNITYNMGATYRLEDYFGNNTLNYSWSAGKYGANNQQSIGPDGNNLVTQIGHPFCPNQLPVDFINFNAEKIDHAVLLKWSTATEINNANFFVERSSDGSNWTAIGEVAGAGNSNSVLNYTFTDYAGINGVAYYRIRQVDADDKFSFSKTLSVKSDAKVVILPNPFSEGLTINTDLTGSIDVTISNAIGQSLFHTTGEAESGSLTIFPEVAPGVYSITIQSDSFIEQRQIIKR